MDEKPVSVASLCESLRTTRDDLAKTLGLLRQGVSGPAETQPLPVRKRLNEFAQILARLEPMTGNAVLAYSYYRAQAIPEFGGRTAEARVKESKASEVREYLEHVDSGGFA